jgi:L-seryl-tRNA(Ser) seleniumtransferase
MMRALRVGKLTLAALSSAIRVYFNDKTLTASLPIFSMLERTEKELKKSAEALSGMLTCSGIKTRVIKSSGQCGGGTLPSLKINSFAVALVTDHKSQKGRSVFAEKVFRTLLDFDYPIVGILRQGEILFDVLTLCREDFPYIVNALSKVVPGNVKNSEKIKERSPKGPGNKEKKYREKTNK